MAAVFYYQTELGVVGIEENGTALTKLYFGEVKRPREAELRETALLQEAGRQVKEYLAGGRKDFTLPLAPVGTDFQQRVWSALREIPYGETRTYGEIAVSIGCPQGARAVGLGNNKNPLLLFIPCHRVVGVNGKLVGYAGGIAAKEYLLNMEKQQISGVTTGRIS
nr:methylated-DNA--[protein]-cysteine S-methyltransferase [uncultured Anaeromusa sp.]